MKVRVIALLCLVLLAGCTTPLPDGSKIQRLAPDAAVAPPLTADEAQRLAQLNARILTEQDAARARDAQIEAWRRAQQQWELDLGYGYPGGYGGYWGGYYSRWHPRWSFGLGWYGPWPY